MISDALNFLQGRLNEFVANKDPFKGAKTAVVLSQLINQNNGQLTIAGDCIALMLTNTEEETVGKSQLPYFKTPQDKLTVLNPDIRLNLYLQFSAYSDVANGDSSAYKRSLTLLDLVVLCFQYRNVFTAIEFPNLATAGIEKIIMEPISLTFEQLNHLWATIGAKYLPSVMYKCKTQLFREAVESTEQPLIKEINSSQNLTR